jgi:hypothetical protein
VTIFVSIESYRDSELVPTVRDCIAEAADPDDLRIVVCWQHAPDEDVPELRDSSRVELLDVDFRDSGGACWARAEIMQRYAGEDFYCQVDSHTRWAPEWDVRAQKMLAATGSPKPLLSAYPPDYQPGREVDPDASPSVMRLLTFDDVLPVFGAYQIGDAAALARPARARFIGANFIFVGGEFVRDVPYDAELYFIGEEITLSLRAFTCGYDMFHPSEVLVYHQYLRDTGRSTGWITTAARRPRGGGGIAGAGAAPLTSCTTRWCVRSVVARREQPPTTSPTPESIFWR